MRITNISAINIFHALFFLLSIFTVIFTSNTALPVTCLDTRCHVFFKYAIDNQYVNKIGQEMLSKKKSEKTKVLSRRLLSITGSHPPNCINRCDNCTPCKRVIVPTHPPQSAGYYPTSWKCKCGNKLYLPQ
ncbi:epidermal patterning factor-like protein [Medicago truncatula]|uniref:Epidermal patterning factor-like protein n=1 Tax=Medicago truncatula TaxID=3880 RepID=A0A072UK76_MEDTR|nr:epidermal patterning factor-like protein [Medicago truncatula]